MKLQLNYLLLIVYVHSFQKKPNEENKLIKNEQKKEYSQLRFSINNTTNLGSKHLFRKKRQNEMYGFYIPTERRMIFKVGLTSKCYVSIEEEITYQFIYDSSLTNNVLIYDLLVKDPEDLDVTSDQITIDSYYYSSPKTLSLRIDNSKYLNIFSITYKYESKSFIRKGDISTEEKTIAHNKFIPYYNSPNNFYIKEGRSVNIYDEYNEIKLEVRNKFYRNLTVSVDFIFQGNEFSASKFEPPFFHYNDASNNTIIFSKKAHLTPRKYFIIRAKIPLMFESCFMKYPTILIIGLLILIIAIWIALCATGNDDVCCACFLVMPEMES
jgi:hypothetical protein